MYSKSNDFYEIINLTGAALLIVLRQMVGPRDALNVNNICNCLFQKAKQALTAFWSSTFGYN